MFSIHGNLTNYLKFAAMNYCILRGKTKFPAFYFGIYDMTCKDLCHAKFDLIHLVASYMKSLALDSDHSEHKYFKSQEYF